MLRLAWIGPGGAADRYAGVSSRLRGASISAVADADRERARVVAAVLGAPVSTASLDELLAGHADTFDAVVIDSPDEPHGAMVLAAAAAGKHVLVEMPLAGSTDESDAAIEACRSAAVHLMVGQRYRFLPPQRTVEESLTSGKLGAPGLLRIHRWEPAQTGARQRSRRAAEGAGGTVMRRVVAEIDLANWLFDTLPTAVYAVGGPDYVQVHLGFPDGAMALIDYCGSLLPGQPYYSISMIGSTGAAYSDDHHDVSLVYGGGRPTALPADYGVGHVVAQVQEFVDAVEGDRVPAITGADGRAAVQVAEAVVESMTSGRSARLSGGRYELV